MAQAVATAVLSKLDLQKIAEEAAKELKALIPGFGTDQDLGKVTRDIVDHFLKAYPTMNVMVVHPPHIASFQDSVKVDISVPYSYVLSRHYSVYLFRTGTFTLIADGGYSNWCFGGNCHRQDKQVTFYERA